VSGAAKQVGAPETVDLAGRRNAVEWIALGLVAITAWTLGAIGLIHDGSSTADALYGSLQLFVLESGPLESPIPLSLEIARWLAPAVAGYAAVRAALVLFRDQFQRMSLRLLLRDHVVIAGLGTKGYALAVALKHAGCRVVAIEPDERNPHVARCRRRDIPVVIGDAADPALLARVRLDRAQRLVVVTDADRRNIEIAFAARRPPERTPLHTLVHLDELALWRLLQAEAVAKRARLGIRLDFFNVREAAARAMLDLHPPFPASGRGRRAAAGARARRGVQPPGRERRAAHRRALAGLAARARRGAADHAGRAGRRERARVAGRA
jgi:voltage-gated potassium channel Kch